MAFFPIPSMLLRQLYTLNSLKNIENGVQFAIKNRLTDVTFSELTSIKINGVEIPKENITFDLGDGTIIPAASISEQNPVPFPIKKIVLVKAIFGNLTHGKHKIEIAVKAKSYGSLKFDVEDAIPEIETLEVRIPRDPNDDYSEKAIAERQTFVEDFSGASLKMLTFSLVLNRKKMANEDASLL